MLAPQVVGSGAGLATYASGMMTESRLGARGIRTFLIAIGAVVTMVFGALLPATGQVSAAEPDQGLLVVSAAPTTPEALFDNAQASVEFVSAVTRLGDKIYFFGRGVIWAFGQTYPDGHGQQIWSYDGVKLERLTNLSHLDTIQSPDNMFAFEGRLYFDANIRGQENSGVFTAVATGGIETLGRELWVYDPSQPDLGTRLVHNLNETAASGQVIGSAITYFCQSGPATEFQGKMYLCADNGVTGAELYVLNTDEPLGAQLELVADLFVGALNPASGEGHSRPHYLTVYKDELYFAANDSGGARLWVYDGVADPRAVFTADVLSASGPAGTPAVEPVEPYDLVVFDGKLFFGATTPATGYELFSFDGSLVKLEADIFAGPDDSWPYSMVAFKGKLYFTAAYEDENGDYDAEPWVFDGSTASLLANINDIDDEGSWPDSYTVVDDLLLFSAYHPDYGLEPWFYSGEGSPQLLQDIEVGTRGSMSGSGSFTKFGDRIYISTAGSWWGLWSFGIGELADVNLGGSGGGPRLSPVGPDPEGDSVVEPAAARGWTRAMADGTIKMYARDVIGAGKVTLRVNGREIAWVRAVDAADPKLNVGPAGQKDGLVRTITLAPGKNALEIFVDGTRIWRAAYTGR